MEIITLIQNNFYAFLQLLGLSLVLAALGTIWGLYLFKLQEDRVRAKAEEKKTKQ